MINFNNTHPELREGEMFLTNEYFPKQSSRQDNDLTGRKFFNNLRFSSKRIGEIAYNFYGKELCSGNKPIFVSAVEY